jgi:general secretion pathway protein A
VPVAAAPLVPPPADVAIGSPSNGAIAPAAPAASPAGASPQAPDVSGAPASAAAATDPSEASAAPAAVLAAAPPAEPAAAAPPELPSLDDAVAASSPATASAEALRALFAVWGVPAEVPPYLPSIEDALARLEGAAFSVLPLRNANLATLELFNHAALLRLRAIDGTPRTVLLVGLEGDQATLVGLRGSEPVRVPWAELEPRWTRETWIPWRDFAELPPILAPGHRGEGVAWLQATLESLGFLSAADRSGVFDEATRDAVQEFQRSRSLAVDGTVGPLTKVILYQSLPELAIPRLVPVRRNEELG